MIKLAAACKKGIPHINDNEYTSRRNINASVTFFSSRNHQFSFIPSASTFATVNYASHITSVPFPLGQIIFRRHLESGVGGGGDNRLEFD